MPGVLRLPLLVFLLHAFLLRGRENLLARCRRAFWVALTCGLVFYLPMALWAFLEFSESPAARTQDREGSLLPGFLLLTMSLLTSLIWGEIVLSNRRNRSTSLRDLLAALQAFVLWPLLHLLVFFAFLFWS